MDETTSKSLVRIEVGEEVIRRHCTVAKNTDEQILRSAAKKTLADEGILIVIGNMVNPTAHRIAPHLVSIIVARVRRAQPRSAFRGRATHRKSHDRGLLACGRGQHRSECLESAMLSRSPELRLSWHLTESSLGLRRKEFPR